MGQLREYRVEMVGAKYAPSRPISVLAHTATIALVQAAIIALDLDAEDFNILPGRRVLASYKY